MPLVREQNQTENGDQSKTSAPLYFSNYRNSKTEKKMNDVLFEKSATRRNFLIEIFMEEVKPVGLEEDEFEKPDESNFGAFFLENSDSVMFKTQISQWSTLVPVDGFPLRPKE